MDNPEIDETRDFWNRVADDWHIQIGTAGDSNRILNSDPVLWAFAGDVGGLRVLDAGCGNGYLSKQLSDRGALVTGIDISERMIAIARAQYPNVEFRVDSCAELRTVSDAQFHLVIANYVLMDTPDLDWTLQAFNRILHPNGMAVLVFSHPCFPQGRATVSSDGKETNYRWSFPYFEPRKCVDPPWGHFSSDFIWFHRPLSDYWKAFKASGFIVLDFEEPRVAEERYHLAENSRKLTNCRTRPYSVAFKLQKKNRAE
ncbi:MAG: methyltransferase domain-containing protein [Acidobacteriia bacterium]|nr:methyltransferase domain-containing protein [Terriglobia bacterium]